MAIEEASVVDLYHDYHSSEIKGFDGTNLKTLKVDTDGRIEALMKGLYDTTPTTIKLDSAGRILAMLNALYNSTETPLKCDANGNLLLNIKAQDLTFITSRPYYGDAWIITGGKTLAPETSGYLFQFTGKVRIFGGIIYSETDISPVKYYITLDNQDTPYRYFSWLKDYNFYSEANALLKVNCWDSVNDRYGFSLAPFIQFETNFNMYIHNYSYGETIRMEYEIFYAIAST